MQLFQIGNAPPASRAGTSTSGQLTRHLGPENADEIQQLPLADVKAITNFGVDFHRLEPVNEILFTCHCLRSTINCLLGNHSRIPYLWTNRSFSAAVDA